MKYKVKSNLKLGGSILALGAIVAIPFAFIIALGAFIAIAITDTVDSAAQCTSMGGSWSFDKCYKDGVEQ